MVAADYTPGEADQLRRDMAAWRRSGRIERIIQIALEPEERSALNRSAASVKELVDVIKM